MTLSDLLPSQDWLASASRVERIHWCWHHGDAFSDEEFAEILRLLKIKPADYDRIVNQYFEATHAPKTPAWAKSANRLCRIDLAVTQMDFAPPDCWDAICQNLELTLREVIEFIEQQA